jgi:hypothetical protein
LVGDTSSSRVILGEGILNEGNHFLNRMFKVGPQHQLSALILLQTKLVAAFF